MERTEDEDRRGSLEEGLGGAESVVRTEEMIGSEDEASTVSDERRNCTLCRYPRTVEYCGGHHIPSGRARAEPPMFDYDDFIENKLPSDIRFSKLLPNDLVRWIECRDVRTEDLLHNYLDWAGDMKHQAKDTAGEDFYAGLVNELEQDWSEQDWSEAVGETVEAFDGASSLGR